MTNILVNWLAKKVELSCCLFQLWFKHSQLSTLLATLLSEKESSLQHLCEVCDSGIVSKTGAVCCRGTLCGGMLVAAWSTSLLTGMGTIHLSQFKSDCFYHVLLDCVHLNLKVSKYFPSQLCSWDFANTSNRVMAQIHTDTFFSLISIIPRWIYPWWSYMFGFFSLKLMKNSSVYTFSHSINVDISLAVL